MIKHSNAPHCGQAAGAHCCKNECRCKPGYVIDGHLSRTHVAMRLQQPTRERTSSPVLSVWSCFEWGLHSVPCCQRTGSLLHCLCTLTVSGGSFLLHCPVSRLNLTLSGILLCEARTFLSRTLSRFRQRPSAILDDVSYYKNTGASRSSVVKPDKRRSFASLPAYHAVPSPRYFRIFRSTFSLRSRYACSVIPALCRMQYTFSYSRSSAASSPSAASVSVQRIFSRF